MRFVPYSVVVKASAEDKALFEALAHTYENGQTVELPWGEATIKVSDDEIEIAASVPFVEETDSIDDVDAFLVKALGPTVSVRVKGPDGKGEDKDFPTSVRALLNKSNWIPLSLNKAIRDAVDPREKKGRQSIADIADMFLAAFEAGQVDLVKQAKAGNPKPLRDWYASLP